MDFIIGAGILQGLFQAFYLWFRVKKKKSSNRILALLVFAFSLNLLHSLFRTGIMPVLGWKITGTFEPFQFLLGPLLYFFVRARTDGKNISVKEWPHFLPVTVIFLFLVLCQYTSFLWVETVSRTGYFLGLLFWD